MQTIYIPDTRPLEGAVKIKVLHPSLQGLIPVGQKLALNLETRTLSLLADGPQLIAVQKFSASEMQMIVPILEFYPHYCPYEVLLSHLTSKVVTPLSIDQCRQRLWEAQNNGTWQQELRPVRRAIASLRTKLYCFNLAISNVRERGCSLTSVSLANYCHLEVLS